MALRRSPQRRSERHTNDPPKDAALQSAHRQQRDAPIGTCRGVETRSEHEDVMVALTTLKPSDQELLRLHAWEELSRNEIAQVLDISVAAVDMRLHRAIARMSVALRSRGFTEHTRRAGDGGGKP